MEMRTRIKIVEKRGSDVDTILAREANLYLVKLHGPVREAWLRLFLAKHLALRKPRLLIPIQSHFAVGIPACFY